MGCLNISDAYCTAPPSFKRYGGRITCLQALHAASLTPHAVFLAFTFMTPQGHVFAGWITFSAFEEEGGTVAQVQVLLRAFDFAYELGFRLGASKSENRFWEQTLLALAAHFGVDEPVRARSSVSMRACRGPSSGISGRTRRTVWWERGSRAA